MLRTAITVTGAEGEPGRENWILWTWGGFEPGQSIIISACLKGSVTWHFDGSGEVGNQAVVTTMVQVEGGREGLNWDAGLEEAEKSVSENYCGDKSKGVELYHGERPDEERVCGRTYEGEMILKIVPSWIHTV